jgi:hypothetical protein
MITREDFSSLLRGDEVVTNKGIRAAVLSNVVGSRPDDQSARNIELAFPGVLPDIYTFAIRGTATGVFKLPAWELHQGLTHRHAKVKKA